MAGEAEAVAALAGALGFGGSSGGKSPYSYGESSSFGFDQSGSKSQGTSSSYSQQFPDQVWGAQAPFFQNLWGQGAGLLAGGAGQQQGQDVYNMGMSGYQNIMNPGSNPLIDIYAQDLGRAFNQNIMPAIQSDAVGGNMIGGSRQGVAQGLGAGEMQRNLQNFASSQYQADMDRVLGALGQMPGFGQFGMGVPWFGLNQMSGLLGAPVVLGQGGYSESQSQNTASASAYGQDSSSAFDISGPKSGFVEPYLPGAGGGTTAPPPINPQNPYGNK